MVDPGTGLAILGGAQVSKEGLVRILGPTADYIGEGVRAWTERRVANVQHVFAKAEDKLGSELDRPGGVPPKVLKAVLEEAQFAEDELTAEYLGGILASSRSEVGRDDRAAVLASLIGGLSTYAVRTHYLFYASAHPLYADRADIDFRLTQIGDEWVFINSGNYATAMDFSDAEGREFDDIFAEAMHSLGRNNLIQEGWGLGSADELRGMLHVNAPSPGIVFRPSQQGVMLFCAAQGIRTDLVGRYARSESFPEVLGVNLPEARHVGPLPPFSVVEAPPGSGGTLEGSVEDRS